MIYLIITTITTFRSEIGNRHDRGRPEPDQHELAGREAQGRRPERRRNGPHARGHRGNPRGAQVHVAGDERRGRPHPGVSGGHGGLAVGGRRARRDNGRLSRNTSASPPVRPPSHCATNTALTLLTFLFIFFFS